MKKITMTLDCPPDITFSTYLISLESLIYLTLLALFQQSAGGNLLIEARAKAPNITICFKMDSNEDFSLDAYPDDEQKLLMDLILASSRIEKKQLFLTFPAVAY